jgi:hypothetical protein
MTAMGYYVARLNRPYAGIGEDAYARRQGRCHDAVPLGILRW